MRVSEIAAVDLDDLGFGCAAFGTGGGGDVAPAIAAARAAIEKNGPVDLVVLDDLDKHDLIMPLSAIGAPTVAIEMLGSGAESGLIRREVERRSGRRVAAVMAAEIGGANGVAPVAWAAELGLPLLDADGMGRAFPELQMISMNVAGVPPGSVTVADALGNVATLDAVDPAWAERWTRALCVASGSSAVMTDYLMSSTQAAGAVVEGTVSHARELGRVVRWAESPIATLVTELSAELLITGKVADILRTTEGGFVRGTIVIAGLAGDAGRSVEILVQNECLAAREDDEFLATVPDLIGLFDSARGDALPIESVRFGQRVSVLAWPCASVWRSAGGLAVVGPGVFGLDVAYQPIEERHAAHP